VSHWQLAQLLLIAEHVYYNFSPILSIICFSYPMEDYSCAHIIVLESFKHVKNETDMKKTSSFSQDSKILGRI
jgi:hypothetical protein